MSTEENPRLLDSMALGFFLCGEHRKAVETQRRAILTLGSDEAELRVHLESKLEKYIAALDGSSDGSSGGAPGDDSAGDAGDQG